MKLTQGEAARLWEDQTKNLRAWEKFVLARDLFLKFSTVNNGMARRLLEEALLIDPNYTGAIVKHGITYYWDARYSVSVDKELFLNLAESDADRGCRQGVRASRNQALPSLDLSRSTPHSRLRHGPAGCHGGRSQSVCSSP